MMMMMMMMIGLRYILCVGILILEVTVASHPLRLMQYGVTGFEPGV